MPGIDGSGLTEQAGASPGSDELGGEVLKLADSKGLYFERNECDLERCWATARPSSRKDGIAGKGGERLCEGLPVERAARCRRNCITGRLVPEARKGREERIGDN